MPTTTDLELPTLQEDLADSFRGPLVGPDDPGYDEHRALYNAMIDRRPGLIARCTDAADVAAGIRAARESGAELAVRAGGHHPAGLSVLDDALVLDLSPMKGIRVDPETRTVRVQAGCTWGDVDHATHQFGAAVPSGVISTTGVAGLTLGGGTGYLSRKYGLTIDSLLSADVVLADGSRVTADEQRHPDLFWALRGGGGNFGVVTSFEFRLHPVDTVLAGMTLWPLERAAEVLRWYREFLPAAPEDLYGFFAFLTVPPVEEMPEELHGERMCGVEWCHLGDPARADEVFAPVLEVGEPALHALQPMPFPALQELNDELYPPGMQWYWRGDFVTEIPDQAVERHVEHGAKLPSMHSTMHLYPIDGAASRPAPDDTAFSYRDANWNMAIVGVDPDPANAGAIREWAIEYHEALHPFSSGGAYVNFIGDEEGADRVRAAYRGNYDRLARVKAEYDPDNLFRGNRNVEPAS